MAVMRVSSIVLVSCVLASSFVAAVSAAHARQLPVGVTTITFTKTSVTSGEPRELATVVWYPAVRKTGTPETFGLRDATPRRGKFPLVVFSHGTCGLPTEASYLTMAIASQGFVVAAPPHPGNTAADVPECLGGPTFIDSAANRQPDVSFVIDSMLASAANPSSRFARRLRDGVIGVMGLSFGGFTTLVTTQLDPRVTASLVLVPGGTAFLDATPITVPVMVIGAERDLIVGFAESAQAYARLEGPRFLVELLAANHLSVVDDCHDNLGFDLCVPGDISQEDAHELVLHYAVPFVRRYLGGKRRAGRALIRQIDGVVLTSEPER
jgi:predicted dienelactone hydrolase